MIDNQYMGNIRQAVPHRFMGSYPGAETYALAQRGLVFLVDGRGTIGRSKAFHDVFKAGVSGAPVVDLEARANRVEPYMGTPQQNPEAYARASNVTLADRLQGQLMIAVGTSDTNVTFTHPMRMVEALEKAGKFFDLVILPGETHTLSPRGQRYYVEARARFFIEHLKP